MEEVILNVEGQKFTVKKSVISWYSDYFKAMLSDNFKERGQREITLHNIDAKSMELILEYITDGDIDISEHSLHVIGNLSAAANLLGFAQLSKKLEYILLEDKNITPENCFGIMAIAEAANFKKLLQTCTRFALSSFYDMKPEFIPSVEGMVWYLSHNQLDIKNQKDIFTFGFNWMSHSKTVEDPSDLLLVLGCLDLKKLTTTELSEIKIQLADFKDTLISQVVDILIELSINGSISVDRIKAREAVLKEKFTDRIYDEVLNAVKEGRDRKFDYTLIFATTAREREKYLPNRCIVQKGEHGLVHLNSSMLTSCECYLPLYKLTNVGAESWFEFMFPPKILEGAEFSVFSWNIAALSPNKMVFVISTKKHGYTPTYLTTIRIYHVLKEEWMDIDTLQTENMCRTLAVVGDTMTIINDTGRNTVYEFRNKSHRAIAELPPLMERTVLFRIPRLNLGQNEVTYDEIPGEMTRVESKTITSCVHNNKIYVSNDTTVYVYKEALDGWSKVIQHDFKGEIASMVSHNGYIYMTNAKQCVVYRFKPEEENTLNYVTIRSAPGEYYPVMKCCDIDNQLLFITITYVTENRRGQRNLYVEKYNEEEKRFDALLCVKNTSLDFDSIMDTCNLVLTPPSANETYSEYLQTCFNNINNMERKQRKRRCSASISPSPDSDIPS